MGWTAPVMSRSRALLGGIVIVMAGVAASACGSPAATTKYNGGNNAPTTKPGPTSPSHPTTTTGPVVSTTTTTTFPITKTTGPTHATPDTPNNINKPGTPEWVAAQYQRDAAAVSWRWPNPYEWIITAKPYMSPTYWATLRAKAGQPLNSATQQFWTQVVTNQEGYWVYVERSLIAVNAPKTPTSCTVVVHYLVGVVKPKGTREPPGGTVTGVAYPMVRIGGTWYVNGPGGAAYGT